jgi:V8-like Glu-specific endopeptidase
MTNYLIENNTFNNSPFNQLVENNRSKINSAILCVGVIKVRGVTSYRGTGWFINAKTLVTNAHILNSTPVNKLDIDMKNEHGIIDKSKRYSIVRPLVVDTDLDIAFFEIAGVHNAVMNLDANASYNLNTNIAIIGYPQLGDYKKHLHIGQITPTPKISDFGHNCLTSNGNSGAPVIDIVRGKVIGLHYHTDLPPAMGKAAMRIEKVIKLAAENNIKTY